jgi:amino acid adenylation domain-containing protein
MVKWLDEWSARQADTRPEALALVAGGERLTYAELEEGANRLARMLRRVGCRPGDRVCFLMPKSPVAIISVLGILKAACIYTPLDTASPAPRIARMLESLDPRLMLAAGRVDGILEALSASGHLRSTALGWLDAARATPADVAPVFTQADVRGESPAALDVRHDDGDPAYILFTSGSTGAPKGVVITHASVVQFVEWAVGYFAIRPGDRQSGHIPLHFDLSVFDMFGAFAAGAELHLVPAELNLLPRKLAAFIRDSQLTQWFSVPSTLTYLAQADAIRPHDFPALKRLLWCGEVVPTRTLRYWMRRLPDATFTNLYGPTETTIASTYYTLPSCPDDDLAPIPIGRPCPGEDAFVLDEQLSPVPPGDSGDLYIGGVGLSPGYWREPEKTAAAFKPHPFSSEPDNRVYKTGDRAKVGDDGLIYFIGRTDTQVKSRGYRIELGEIEAAVNALTSVRDAAVVAVATGGFESATICCAYVPADSEQASPVQVRTQLSRVLPGYMQPTRWEPVASLPRNANGKIDRQLVKAEFERTAVETPSPAAGPLEGSPRNVSQTG